MTAFKLSDSRKCISSHYFLFLLFVQLFVLHTVVHFYCRSIDTMWIIRASCACGIRFERNTRATGCCLISLLKVNFNIERILRDILLVIMNFCLLLLQDNGWRMVRRIEKGNPIIPLFILAPTRMLVCQ